MTLCTGVYEELPNWAPVNLLWKIWAFPHPLILKSLVILLFPLHSMNNLRSPSPLSFYKKSGYTLHPDWPVWGCELGPDKLIVKLPHVQAGGFFLLSLLPQKPNNVRTKCCHSHSEEVLCCCYWKKSRGFLSRLNRQSTEVERSDQLNPSGNNSKEKPISTRALNPYSVYEPAWLCIFSLLYCY